MNVRPLVKGLKSLEDRAETGELAFYCLNGQSENHIRDIVAFNIARAHPDWQIRREHSNVDLSIQNKRGSLLDVEFKIGYVAGVVRNDKKNKDAHVIKSARTDYEKRSMQIVNCIGLMDFENKCDIATMDLSTYRCRHYINDCISDRQIPKTAIAVVKKVWQQRRVKVVSVDCGVWNEIAVQIHFVVVWDATKELSCFK